MQKCQPFSLYSPLFTYPAPYIGFESYYTFKYNRSSLVLINSWNRNSNSVCHSINSRCRHVNSRCYNANSRCNDDNSRTKWSVYKYIYIDLYNVSERYIEVPSAVCENVHVHYTSIKFHCETSFEQLLSMRPCNFPSLKYSQIRPSFLFKLVFISMYFIIHAFKKWIPLFDSLLSVLKKY